MKRLPEQVLAALFLTAVGVVAMLRSWSYGLGSSSTPGSGYFPLLVSAVLTLLGLIVAWREWRAREVVQSPWPWRSLGFISAALLAFVLLIGGVRAWGVPAFGLLPATFVLVTLSSRAGPAMGWRETLVLSTILTALAWLVFVQLLSLSVPLWPWTA